VNRFGLRSLSTLAVATVAFTGIGATAAGAKTSPALKTATNSSSFVGTYRGRLEATGTSSFLPVGKLVLNADGTAAGRGLHAKWSNVGTTLTITAKGHGVTAVLTAVQTKTGNLSSMTKPGTYTVNGTPVAVWYAVKLP
jgi:hypothetical protein